MSKRAQRLTTANGAFVALRSELAFEQITIVRSDFGRHWQFLFGAKHIADYWPASGRGQIVGQRGSCVCASAAQAKRLALLAKKRLFAAIAKAMVQTSEPPILPG